MKSSQNYWILRKPQSPKTKRNSLSPENISHVKDSNKKRGEHFSPFSKSLHENPKKQNKNKCTKLIQSHRTLSHTKGFSFGSEVKRSFENFKKDFVGPGSYNVSFDDSRRILPRIKSNSRSHESKSQGPAPNKYNLSKDFININENMNIYRKMHESAWKQKKQLEELSSLDFSPVLRKEPSIYDLVKSTVSMKQRIMLKIRDSINKIERKKTMRASLAKKPYGFTTAPRKNEYNILQKLIISPGPIYNIREDFAKNAIKINIPLEKRKSMWENSENIPGPGTYNLKRYLTKSEGEIYKEFHTYVKRQKILKTILKN